MNNIQTIPYLHRIETLEGYTAFINPSIITRIEYHPVNSNWSDIYVSGENNPYTVRILADDLIEQISVGYRNFLAKL